MQSRPFISWLEIWLFISSIAVGLSVLFIAFAVYAKKNRKSAGGFEVTLKSAVRKPERNEGSRQ